jgi:hypothetical protein
VDKVLVLVEGTTFDSSLDELLAFDGKFHDDAVVWNEMEP